MYEAQTTEYEDNIAIGNNIFDVVEVDLGALDTIPKFGLVSLDSAGKYSASGSKASSAIVLEEVSASKTKVSAIVFGEVEAKKVSMYDGSSWINIDSETIPFLRVNGIFLKKTLNG